MSARAAISGVLYQDLVTILVATGLHRPNTTDELIRMVGKEVVDD